MNRRLNVLSTWPSRLLLIGMGLLGGTLFAQASGDQPAPAAQQETDKDKKPAPAAKQDDARRQQDLGVAVDSGRKSDALATWRAGLVTETITSGTGAPDSSSTLPVRLAEATAWALKATGATAIHNRAAARDTDPILKLIRCISTPGWKLQR